jgi:hypothetical protein
VCRPVIYAITEQPDQLRTGLFEPNTEITERLCGNTSLLAQQTEQQVLRTDVGMPKVACLGH